jgi:hypothetical protein
MAPHDMSDLVTHDPSELVEAVGLLDGAAVHIDKAARERECIHLA